MKHRISLAMGVGGLAALTSATHGAVILQAGGWQAEVDDGLVGAVSLTNLGFDPQLGTLTISKTATFSSVNGLTGQPDSIVITWTQIADDANTAAQIIIDSELVTNSTGLAWVAFEIAALDSGDAAFNEGLSAGFTISPFTTRTYSPDDTVVTFSDGTVGAGSQWRPGAGGGELVLDVDLSRDDAMTFSLKELPLIPAPGAVITAAAGVLLLAPRRRR